MYKILAKTLFLGKELIYVPSCHSTNDLALQKLQEPDTKEGLILITDNQTQGRGQRGNSWQSASGQNLLFSIVLKPNWLDAQKQFYMNIITSLAIQRTVSHFVPEESVKIKWPNDILIQQRKLAGILIENSIRRNHLESAVVGIGLNINQSSFKEPKAISLNMVSHMEYNRQAFLEQLIVELEGYYLQLKAGKYGFLKAEYLDKLYGYRYSIRLKSEYEFLGTIEDVGESGILKVSSQNNIYQFDFKEIEFVL